MRTVPDNWDPSTSHQMAVKVAPPNDPENALPVSDGSVTLEANVPTRGRCDLTFDTLDMVPDSPAHVLAPFGQELQIWRGIGETMISLGIFRIDEADSDENENGIQTTVSGTDRSSRIIDAAFEDPYQITGGTDYLTAIQNTITAIYPDVDFNFPAYVASCPTVIASEGDDRWEFVQDMAAAIGMELFFDGDGVLVMRPIPAVTSEGGTWDINLEEGDDVGNILLSANKNWSREDSANKWIVTGENTGETTVSRGTATDTNLLSPTRYGGPFGIVPKFESYEFITSDAQAAVAAQGLLDRNLGIAQSIDFGVIVNPALEPGDRARIVRPKLHIEEIHILESLTIPLTAAGVMDGTTRAVQVGS